MSAFGAAVNIMGEMHADDMNLVREFAVNGSEAAFATLVGRHINLVYSAALRQLGNAHEAEEVAQAVFIILARKAGNLRRGTILSGWLYQTAQLTAANFRRAAIRRQRRVQEAFMQFSEQSQPDVYWHRLAPLLEEAMSRLGQKERNAVVLRFFEGCTVREVAAALGLREDAAQKRVNRGTTKLREYFVRRGIQVSTAALLASIGTHSVQAAPMGLTKTISAVAITKGTAASTSTLTLVKGALKIMAWTKAQTIIAVGVGVLLAAGTATVVEKIRQPHEPIYQGKPLSVWLKQYDLTKLSNGSIDWKTYGARFRETNKVVQQAGTNAIPTLLRLLQEENIKKHNVDNNGEEVDMAFAALGGNAKDSVPSLIEIYGRNPAARGDVLYSLNCIGTNADVPIDWLLPKLKDPDPQIRAGI
jgi:RNA polymerase sigma factor (sigma-70 family)